MQTDINAKIKSHKHVRQLLAGYTELSLQSVQNDLEKYKLISRKDGNILKAKWTTPSF